MAIDALQLKANNYLQAQTKAASLAVFRILFGSVMLLSIIRFWSKGWIEKLYLDPHFHFHYAGFSFVNVPGRYTYLLFLVCGMSALFVALGFKYRWAVILFFLSFTYIELLDKTTYLNHYYFVSVISFMLIWLPAQATYSVDAWRDDSVKAEFVPRWTVDVLKLMLAIVYIYAGLAKLNPDWMLRAMPLSIWLPSKLDVPLLGGLMHEKWMHYLFSWGGAVYDLTIVFFLMWSRTRILAFIAVILFHLMTRVLFPIGMFPYIMICCTLIFFSPQFHVRCLSKFFDFMKIDSSIFKNNKLVNSRILSRLSLPIVASFMLFQLVFPARSLAYDTNVYWTEQGYRFSWRVMLMEKTATANFKIVDQVSGKRFYVQNHDFLTAVQQKQMATQPDFILEYGQYLGRYFAAQGHQNVAVYVDSYAALNGRSGQEFISPDIDLMTVSYKDLCNKHISPLNE